MRSPPVAPIDPTVVVTHGHRREDPYAWLRLRDDPRTLAYLQAENDHCEALLADSAAFREQLYLEMLARIEENDVTVPVREGAYWYVQRTREGSAYVQHYRRSSEDGEEKLLLDENVEAASSAYFRMGLIEPDPSERLVAWAADRDGAELFELRFRDPSTGEDVGECLTGLFDQVVWMSPRALLYVTRDPSHRPHRVWQHQLGTARSEDVLVYEEPDESFFVSLTHTRSRRFAHLRLRSRATIEVRVCELGSDGPASFRTVLPREHGVEYELDHAGDRFFIRINDAGAENFRVVSVPVDGPAEAPREEWVPGLLSRPIDAIAVFAGHLVVMERESGLVVPRIIDLATRESKTFRVDEPTFAVTLGDNRFFSSPFVRLEVESLVTPRQVWDVDLATGTPSLRKQWPVRGGFDPSRYVSWRTEVVAKDGVHVPISVVRRADTPLDGTAPLWLLGYGAYGHPEDVYFSTTRLSLLDRGHVFAFAHVRGGSDLGHSWYRAGKLANKPNSFTDYIACAEHLVQSRVTSSDRLIARGGSAGGLLVGAAANLRPDLFAQLLVDVPFVDVLNSMLDEKLPLTIIEWEEWGDPRKPDDYAAMLSWAPYENVRAGHFPDVIATGGFNDTRVPYWEPAKWVAKLRATVKARRIVLWTNLGAGHGGPSGRYSALRDVARQFAFAFDGLGQTGAPIKVFASTS